MGVDLVRAAAVEHQKPLAAHLEGIGERVGPRLAIDLRPHRQVAMDVGRGIVIAGAVVDGDFQRGERLGRQPVGGFRGVGGHIAGVDDEVRPRRQPVDHVDHVPRVGQRPIALPPVILRRPEVGVAEMDEVHRFHMSNRG